MPSPAGKRAWGKGAFGGLGSPGGAQVQSQSLPATLPEQHILYWASWHQGFRRQEAPGATNLPCGFNQVIPHFWLKDRQNREIQEPGVSLASAPSGPREPCLGCAFL